MLIKKTVITISLVVLCVSLADLLVAKEFVDNKNGTVTDNKLGITWQAEDDNVQRDWQSAKKYCADLELAGFDDWRAPNNYELRSIYQEKPSSPQIDLKLFPKAKASRYWTGNAVPYYIDKAFFVNFDKAKLKGRDELMAAMVTTKNYYVRCIRGKRKRAKR